jgi:hypothetical protein
MEEVWSSRAAGMRRVLFGPAPLVLLGLLIGVAQGIGLLHHPIDFVLYWRETDPLDLYPLTWTDPTRGYVYPPPMALVLIPFHVFPWPIATALWSMLLGGCLWYAARWAGLPLIGLGLAGLAVGFVDATTAVLSWFLLGNVQIIMAAAIVGMLRFPALAAIPLLTKVGTGVGIVWFAAGGEWRKLGVAVAATGMVVLVSYSVAPAAWLEWVSFVVRVGDPDAGLIPVVGPPFPVRLLAAAALVAWGARTERPWTIPIAAGMAIPAMYAWSFLPVWVGVVGVLAPRGPGELLRHLRHASHRATAAAQAPELDPNQRIATSVTPGASM